VPSLVLDGAAVPILHESQLASLLGLPAPPGSRSSRTAGDTVTVLGSWCVHIEPLDWELLTASTRSRSLRNLTVNVFHPFELVPVAWRERRFEWDPELDEEREAAIESSAALGAYASTIRDGWAAFLTDVGGALDDADPIVSSPRGELSFSSLLEQQRWHAAFHHRQLVDFLRENDRDVAHLDVRGFAGLELPRELY
jgi:hypothetical protein